jgi:hypothetical protein
MTFGSTGALSLAITVASLFFTSSSSFCMLSTSAMIVAMNSYHLSIRYTTCEAGEIVNEKRILYLGPKFLFIDVTPTTFCLILKYGANDEVHLLLIFCRS